MGLRLFLQAEPPVLMSAPGFLGKNMKLQNMMPRAESSCHSRWLGTCWKPPLPLLSVSPGASGRSAIGSRISLTATQRGGYWHHAILQGRQLQNCPQRWSLPVKDLKSTTIPSLTLICSLHGGVTEQLLDTDAAHMEHAAPQKARPGRSN